MKLIFRDFDHQIYKVAAQDIIAVYLKGAFWLSWTIPFGAWKIFELIKEKGWIG